MISPDFTQKTQDSVEFNHTTKPAKQLSPIEILDPVPVSKWNLYVLIGCTVLVVLLVLLGPWLYPQVQDYTSNFWEQFK
ncbi:hypothetical protein ccrud_09785 [Corynebacterium crudilactis]|uniref:Uncharacterized protein n=1 Tax=Corynebacterium crudilactis TaxID=1652495 RepID=A0A172QXE4_9CORY|nr:hypothetical protein ccrud_09785 [Corynebacterium crudilactis]